MSHQKFYGWRYYCDTCDERVVQEGREHSDHNGVPPGWVRLGIHPNGQATTEVHQCPHCWARSSRAIFAVQA